MPCKNIKGIAYTSDTDKQNTNDFSRIRCKQWTCGYCAQHNRQQWRAVIFKHMHLAESWSFWTITLPAYVSNFEDSAEFIRKEWDALLKALRKHYGNFPYVRVIEEHKPDKQGRVRLHVHMLAGVYVPDSRRVDRKNGTHYYTSDEAKAIVAVDNKKRVKQGLKPVSRRAWGYIFSVENLNTVGKSVRYVTKYMTKREESFENGAKKSKLRIIQTSRDIKFQTEKTASTWRMKDAIFAEDLRLVQWHDLNTNKTITPDDLRPFYPHPADYGIEG